MSFSAADAGFMARALQLAQRGLYTTDPNPRVGCVIAKDGKIVGEGFHARKGEAHAEVEALRQATQRARGATVYVTLEPCCHHGRTPPCTDALLTAGVRRVVAAMQDPNPRVAGKGFEMLAAAGVTTENGLMEVSAKQLNPGFIQRMTQRRPFVRIKVAATLDGRTALANGESKWITSEHARNDVQTWRARSSAIVTGVATAIADDPALTVRRFDIGRQPLRVVLDSHLRLPPTAQLLRQSGATLIVAVDDPHQRAAALRAANAEILFLPGADGKVDLVELMSQLAAREINEVLVEAGATLCGTLVRNRLVDEFVLYYGPSLFGNHARGMFGVPSLADIDSKVRLDIVDTRAIGKDWRIIARPEY
jgi:diaminohydroxyphosphoribosylaminopyrimidine deaminase/5-amino-6-(5-phosphoribosylamino)uracil reductase